MFPLACRYFSGYFSFSRWPGRLETRRLAAARIGPAPLVLTLSMVESYLSRQAELVSGLAGRTCRSFAAFVASVPGKDRQSLAFSRCPGGMESLRKLADLIGRQRRVSLTLRLFSRFTLLARVCCRSGSPGRPVFAFVASVPGKNGQSLCFGLYGFGFFEFIEGLAGVRGIQLGASERVWPVQ